MLKKLIFFALLWLNFFTAYTLHSHSDENENLGGEMCSEESLIADECWSGVTFSDDAVRLSPGKSSVCESEVSSERNDEMPENAANFVEQLENVTESKKEASKSDRLLHDVPLGFDEFKNKAINPKGKSAIDQAGSILHRVEPDGKEYNYASAAKGAKVLHFNKEAKGASNILGKDMDKYLRNPCSAEEKFVVIELSEETLVVTIELANFEHHSSNFKDFQVLGSFVYPTDSWVELGNFSARNVKQSQKFTLREPKWVRYLRLNFLSHYGSEFYCTLSFVQVYGVDAVERMLEDLISDQVQLVSSENKTDQQKINSSQVTHPQTNDSFQSLVTDGNSESITEDTEPKSQNFSSHSNDQAGELRPQHVGRMPADSVMKILMQKVRSLDVNLSVLERYLEGVISRYGNIFKDLEKEIAEKNMLLEKIRTSVVNLVNKNEAIVKDVSEIVSWKSHVQQQIDKLQKENALLRLEVEKVLQSQEHMDNKCIVMFLIISICSLSATIKLLVEMAVSVCRREQDVRSFCRSNFSWIVFIFSCSAIAMILLL